MNNLQWSKSNGGPRPLPADPRALCARNKAGVPVGWSVTIAEMLKLPTSIMWGSLMDLVGAEYGADVTLGHNDVSRLVADENIEILNSPTLRETLRVLHDSKVLSFFRTWDGFGHAGFGDFSQELLWGTLIETILTKPEPQGGIWPVYTILSNIVDATPDCHVWSLVTSNTKGMCHIILPGPEQLQLCRNHVINEEK